MLTSNGHFHRLRNLERNVVDIEVFENMRYAFIDSLNLVALFPTFSAVLLLPS